LKQTARPVHDQEFPEKGELVIRILSCAILLLSSSTVFAQDDGGGAAQANNPLANSTAVNIQNQFTGELTGVGKSANQFYLRAAQPFDFLGGRWIARATLPVNTFPTGSNFDHETGLGDFNIFAAYLFDVGNPGISFGFGPQLTVPSATQSGLGSEKWSAGFANVLFNATNPKYQWGYLLTWQASFAGDDDRDDVNVGAFQPFLFYQLQKGWYLRSSATWTYNFENDAYTLPIGLGLGKVIKTEKAVVNMFVEPQYSIAKRGNGQSEWGLFTGVNFQF